jgi:hypothetical protein
MYTPRVHAGFEGYYEALLMHELDQTEADVELHRYVSGERVTASGATSHRHAAKVLGCYRSSGGGPKWRVYEDGSWEQLY